MDGASVLEDAWLGARAGEHGYLAGKDAEAVACDALIVPVVTGSPDWAAIARMIGLVLDAYAHARARPGRTSQGTTGTAPCYARGPGADGRCPPKLGSPAVRHGQARDRLRVRPRRLASALRAPCCAPPTTARASLDIGYSDTIPEAIRRAVIARDKHCAWPGGCGRRPAASDVHHIKHKKDGGPTSVKDCVLLCQYHHDICIHRLGWRIELLPDGSTRATSPEGRPSCAATTTAPPNPTRLTHQTPTRLTPNGGTEPPPPRPQPDARDRKAPHRPRAPARPYGRPARHARRAPRDPTAPSSRPGSSRPGVPSSATSAPTRRTSARDLQMRAASGT